MLASIRMNTSGSRQRIEASAAGRGDRAGSQPDNGDTRLLKQWHYELWAPVAAEVCLDTRAVLNHHRECRFEVQSGMDISRV